MRSQLLKKLICRPEQCFKTLVTESPDHNNYVFVIPGPAELDLKKAAKAAECKSISLIPLKKLLPLTGYLHGGCSPIGMKKAFSTFIDETAILYDCIGVSGGQVGLNLTINPETLAGFIDAKFVDHRLGLQFAPAPQGTFGEPYRLRLALDFCRNGVDGQFFHWQRD